MQVPHKFSETYKFEPIKECAVGIILVFIIQVKHFWWLWLMVILKYLHTSSVYELIWYVNYCLDEYLAITIQVTWMCLMI